MNISSRQLAGFVQAAQLGSFTKAAERLNVTQAGLSAIIRSLEEQLGCRLFDRTTRMLSLTEAGQKFLPIAIRTVEDLAAASSELGQITLLARQTIRVGATPVVACKLLPAVCSVFRRTHPEVTVRILELQRDRIQELVSESELDLGLGIFLKVVAGIERLPLLQSKLMLVSPASGGPRRPGRAIGTVRWCDLPDGTFVALQPDNPVQQLIERQLRANASVGNARYFVNHIETQIAMVEIGTGSAIIPSFALPACRHYRVKVEGITDPVAEIDFHRISKKGKGQAAALDAFTRSLVKVMRPLMAYSGTK